MLQLKQKDFGKQASWLLTEFEQNYSIIEPELVWAKETFQTLENCDWVRSILGPQSFNDNKRQSTSKTFSSILTRWVDRLRPFQFKEVHAPAHTTGIADYRSRHSSINNGEVSKIKAEEFWFFWFAVNEITRNDITVLANQNWQKNANQPKRAKLMNETKPHELQKPRARVF